MPKFRKRSENLLSGREERFAKRESARAVTFLEEIEASIETNKGHWSYRAPATGKGLNRHNHSNSCGVPA